MAAEAVLSAVLKELLSKLSSLVQNEIGLLWGLEGDKKKLESNLSVIRAVLHDAEMRQVNEMAVRDWLGKLKDAAYDAEDLVDEFIFEARRRKVVNQQGMRKKVCDFCSLSNPLVFRTKMAHKMQELRKRFDGIAEERIAFHFKVEVVQSRPLISRTRETCSYVIESEVCGRDDEKEKLIGSLINSGDEEVLSVIPIVGMGGLGKTTLAQLIFNDERVGTHFDLKMWVYVSEDFNVGRLLKEILQSAIKREAEKLSIDLLHARLRETLSGKKYLLVLDDVWNEEFNEWSRLNTWLKCGGMGSKILATTRSDKVAAIMGPLPAHKLGILSEEESWTLFEKLARPLPNFVSMGKEMVGKCGGLPLAIKTLGGLMSSKRTQSEWESVKNSEFWNPQDNDGGVLPALRLSYDHLTPSLKQCFEYCAIVPKGREVWKDKLIKQWIAQGIIHSDGENDLLEEKGEVYFNELLQRSLFHVGAMSFGGWYNMHDLIHDLLRFIVGAEYSIVEASMKIDPSTEIHHLSSQDWNEQRELKILEALKICKKLRTVSLLSHSFDVTVLSSLRCLRVLDLSDSTITYLPNSIDKLKHLRYLDITYTWIEELPESICNLHSLQTLKLGYAIKNLPKNMKKMISLRHVKFHGSYPAPKGIGELTCLRTWPIFVFSEESGAGIEELKSLNQLSGYIYIKGLDNIRNGACAREANLKAKQYLGDLVLCWPYGVADIEGNSEEVIKNLEPHPNLKRLIVNHYMGLKFPGWMMILTNLVHLELSGCKRCEHLPPLWELPLLESLEMEGLSDLKYIVEFDGDHNCKDVFPSLKSLHIVDMPNLEAWSAPGEADHEQVTFPQLMKLEVKKCPRIVHFPHLLPSLKILSVAAINQMLLGSVANNTSLTELSIEGFPEVRCLPEELGPNHAVLHTFEIRDCPRLMSVSNQLENLHALKTLVIAWCTDLVLSLPDGGLQNHQQQSPPLNSLEMLRNLTSLEINGCPKVFSSPVSLKNLKSLRLLKIYSCPGMSSLPESIGDLKSLTSLSIWSCPGMSSLPESIGDLTSLTSLSILLCPVMSSLPESIGDLTSLTRLVIQNCPGMSSLPESMGHLQ